jgi:hypothetical protein
MDQYDGISEQERLLRHVLDGSVTVDSTLGERGSLALDVSSRVRFSLTLPIFAGERARAWAATTGVDGPGYARVSKLFRMSVGSTHNEIFAAARFSMTAPEPGPRKTDATSRCPRSEASARAPRAADLDGRGRDDRHRHERRRRR